MLKQKLGDLPPCLRFKRWVPSAVLIGCEPMMLEICWQCCVAKDGEVYAF
ncbi:hypothetical protein ES288_A05G055600v1 [Gossypium darwinii]|uniref:Uncharacterized protein n=1 Tax=Gossypium darwinii TaxID=34276 RepID=A0A5D2GCC0_GOSDA|nr:hypothetical protein ES288_A05G055600v1 [Gossypium darwinii]